MTADLEHILQVLRQHPGGLDRRSLLLALQERWPYLMAEQLDRYLTSAGEAIVEVDGRLSAAATEQAVDYAEGQTDELRRFVAVDLESIVRPIIEEPYREQHVFQIGAVRFGPDEDWVGNSPRFSVFMELPSGEDELLIHRDDFRETYLQHKRPPVEALENLRHYCLGADVLVAYNGIAHDFPLLQREFERAGLSPLYETRRRTGPLLVDGLYLANALWPILPRQHQLKELLKRLEIDKEELSWHNAVDDAEMLVELLTYGARVLVTSWEPSLLSLVASAATNSDAWAVLLALCPSPVEHRTFEGPEVTHVLSQALSARTALRPAAESEQGDAALVAFTLPDVFLAEDGTIDIARLIEAVKGEQAEPRASQREMVRRMRDSLFPAQHMLLEAPTGVGKSLAILTVALDWLAADADNRVIISTFTKQLQGQLAEDIERLNDIAIPGLVSVSDMVKGARNRLSLRALVVTLSDFTHLGRRNARRSRSRAEFRDDGRFAEVVIYLALRFIAQGRPIEEWEARSVDRVDIPAFFDQYCPRRLGLYLASLSQADAGDYPRSRGGIARHTAFVDEALRSRRLVIANHALLLAHLDKFQELGEHLLLVVDEAHELENTATTALSATAETAKLEKVVADAGEWLADQQSVEALGEVEVAVRGLDRLLDDSRLHRAALQAFDTAETDPLGRATLRTITVASPVQGDAHVEPMEHLARELRSVYASLRQLNRALVRCREPHDPFDADRLAGLRDRSRDAIEGLGQVIADIDAVLAPTVTTGPMIRGSSSQRTGAASALAVDQDLSAQLALLDETEMPQIETDGQQLDDSSPLDREGPANRLVWADEVEELPPGSIRDYRFRLTSSPIVLGRERVWHDFLRKFPRAYFVSATLRVSDSWDFIRERLGLGEEVQALALPSPFNPRDQARLICFEDFPSWAEHEEAAMRTAAYQLTGYARELLRVGQDGRAWANGAMVLTTSRAAAAGIFDHLARLRTVSAVTVPMFSAGLEGNQRAVETFKREGGILVGTRGLWQGVDIDEPSRLRLVWINKLPFASFADPIIAARREMVRQRAEVNGADDPDSVANEMYYLPLAAISLRQAVGRLIRSQEHRGVIVISDRKLAGPTRLRHLYRRVFLGSLDPGFLVTDAETGEPTGGNLVTMVEGWRRIFSFLAETGVLEAHRAAELCNEGALYEFTELPETRAIKAEELSFAAEAELRARGPDALSIDLVGRCQRIAAQLRGGGGELILKPKQIEAIQSLAHDRDLLARAADWLWQELRFSTPGPRPARCDHCHQPVGFVDDRSGSHPEPDDRWRSASSRSTDARIEQPHRQERG